MIRKKSEAKKKKNRRIIREQVNMRERERERERERASERERNNGRAAPRKTKGHGATKDAPEDRIRDNESDTRCRATTHGNGSALCAVEGIGQVGIVQTVAGNGKLLADAPQNLTGANWTRR